MSEIESLDVRREAEGAWYVTFGYRGQMSTILVADNSEPRILASGRTWSVELLGWTDDGAPRVVVHEDNKRPPAG